MYHSELVWFFYVIATTYGFHPRKCSPKVQFSGMNYSTDVLGCLNISILHVPEVHQASMV